MGTQDERGKVRSAIRGLMEADRAADGLKPPEHYKGLFAGHGDLVAEEHEVVAKDSGTLLAGEGSGATVTSHRSPTPAPATPLPLEAPPEVDRVGPYRVLRELGRGGMGVVYLAEDTRVCRKVALKVLPAAFAASRHLLARFRREASIASRLDHPGICTVYEAGEEDGVAFMAMRYLEGESLATWISKSRGTTGRKHKTTGCVTGLPGPYAVPPSGPAKSSPVETDIARVVALFEKLARALHAAHEAGLIHRDIKPGNVMVTKDGEPVLLDFGLARAEDDEQGGLTQTGSLMGTPAYMSPEQLVAQRIKLDRRTDIYSLGVALYECLTLKLPFEAPTLDALYQQILATDPENPRRLNAAIPLDLKVIVDTGLEKDRKRRYQTALGLAEDLRRFREHEPISARPVGPLGRLLRWSQRSPALAAAVGLVFVSISGGLAVSIQQWRRATDALSETTRERDAKSRAVAEREQALAEKERALTESQSSLRAARALGLAGASEKALSEDNMLANLLAREAVRTSERSESVSALQVAIRQPVERCILLGHELWVHSAVFSPDGQLVLTASRDKTARLWSLAGSTLAVLRGHERDVNSAAFSPDGTRLLTTSDDGTARLWDLAGRQLVVLRGHSGEVPSAVFSPDGQRVLTASWDGTARLWDQSGKELVVFRGHTGRVHTAVFSPDGQRILTASSDGTARLWDIGGAETAVLHGHTSWVYSAVFSPDGVRILTAGADDKTARVWDLAGSQLMILAGHQGRVNSATFSPDGQRILTASDDGTARIWSSDGKELSVLRSKPLPVHSGRVRAAVFSPDGGWIFTSSEDSVARLWDPFGRQVTALQCHHGAWNGAFSPGGDCVITSSSDGSVHLWDLSRVRSTELRGHEREVNAAQFSPDGTSVLTISEDETARLWNRAGKPMALIPGRRWVRCAAFSPDGKRVLTEYSWNQVRVSDLNPLSALPDLDIAPRIQPTS